MNDAESDYGLARVPGEKSIPAPQLHYLPPTPKSYRPKIGLIGAGGISEYHLRAYQRMGLDVVAICDLDRSRAESRREEFCPTAEVTSDFQQILQSDDIEVLDITTHPEDRVEIVTAALECGKHVLSQKPFVVDLDIGQQLVELADEKQRKLAVNQNGRWAPHFAYLAAAIQQGIVGPVSSVDFSLQWDHTWTAGTAFEEIHHLLLYDFAIHWFDITNVFLANQQAEQVFASVQRASYQEAKPPFLAQAVIEYPGTQVRLSLNANVVLGQEDRTTVVGRDGTLRAAGPSLNEQTVYLWTQSGHATAQLQGSWFENGFEGTMGELLLAIEEDREPANSARSVLRSLEICFAALASADRKLPVRPGEIRSIPK